MIVRYVPVTGDPILEMLRDLVVFASHVDHVPSGDPSWAIDLANGIPSHDRDIHVPKWNAHLPDLQHKAQMYLPPDVACRAAYYWPTGGGLSWHTNSSRPGWRIYVPVAVSGELMAGTLTESGSYPDRTGLANAFHIDSDYRKSWHAVCAATPRLSIGIWLPSDSPRMRVYLDRSE